MDATCTVCMNGIGWYGLARLLVRKQDSQFKLTVLVFIYIRSGEDVVCRVCFLFMCCHSQCITLGTVNNNWHVRANRKCVRCVHSFSIFAKHRQRNNRRTLSQFSTHSCLTFSGCPVNFTEAKLFCSWSRAFFIGWFAYPKCVLDTNPFDRV